MRGQVRDQVHSSSKRKKMMMMMMVTMVLMVGQKGGGAGGGLSTGDACRKHMAVTAGQAHTSGGRQARYVLRAEKCCLISEEE